MNKLSVKDILILGLMNFAFFVGAGNIIFPPFIGLQAGSNVWSAAFGFLLTGVGLPVLAAIAMARAEGNLREITQPLGIKGGALITIICYLCIGPLFATPRTATVSYALGFHTIDPTQHYMWLYSLLYFAAVIAVSLYPSQLLNVVGKVLSPIKTTALFFLSITALLYSSGQASVPAEGYTDGAFSQGLVNGYLTMDTLASLVFGLLIVNAVRTKGIQARPLITRYAVLAGIIAGACLIFIYLGLFKLGTNSTEIVHNASNGTEVLSAYVGLHFGLPGTLFLSALITIACFVTAVGLTCACGSYFSEITPFSYRTLVWVFALFSMLVANLGLTELIKVSAPVLTAIYPLFIVLIVTSFFHGYMQSPTRVVVPAAIMALVFGIYDGLAAAGLTGQGVSLIQDLPLYQQGLAWLLPTAVLLIIAYLLDNVRGRSSPEYAPAEEM